MAKIEKLPKLPDVLQKLLDNRDYRSSHFLKYLRKYNNALSMTSFGCNEVSNVFTKFKVYGQLYHRIGSLLPEKKENWRFLQLYFIDNEDEQASPRKQNTVSETIDLKLIKKLQIMMHGFNKYV